MTTTRRELLFGAGSMMTSMALWGAGGAYGFEPPDDLAGALASHQLHTWNQPDRAYRFETLRRGNPEWILLWRTFFGLSMANLALGDPTWKARALHALVELEHDTMNAVEQHGQSVYLLPYGGYQAFKLNGRSLFVDGQVALLTELRAIVQNSKDTDETWLEAVRASLKEAPVGAESYPDECWVYCHMTALLALRMAERRTGRTEPLIDRWLETSLPKLIEPSTGLMFSSFRVNGDMLDGPEGSSLYWSMQVLSLLRPELGREQYERTTSELSRSLLGFGWVTEWPASLRGPSDIDSGLVIPGLDASPAAAGHALAATLWFGDEQRHTELTRALALVGVPEETEGGMRFAASNLVGDALLLHGLVVGPLWNKLGNRENA